jgi:alkanesulfonate monooxygenase SsuD/methylene tetrahydromethanopterin reductase-like flavin-dependent oxidoreductase (luciferase family)
MAAEFRALGVQRSQRGKITDETLDFFERCFTSDEVEANGQTFLFRPRPPKPPLFIGGAPAHAIRRAIRFGGGWMPMGGEPAQLQPAIEELRTNAARAGRPAPEVAVVTTLPLEDLERSAAQARAFAAAGATRIVHGFRYSEPAPFLAAAEKLAQIGSCLPSG